jgi:hypothetical protein
MNSVQPRAYAHALFALACASFALLLGGCTPGMPDQSDARLTVTTTQPTGTYQPGDDIAYRFTVTNAGPRDVGHLSIETRLDANVREKSLTCSPLGASAAFAGDADCSPFIYMLKLAKGASVTLDVVVTVHSASAATITNTVTAALISGPAAVTVSSSASVVDARGGTYQAFTSTGQALAVAADFASATATFSGSGHDVVLPFTTAYSDETYLLPGGAAFRAPHDLLVGTVDLGGGAKPFIAGRAFVQTIAALDGHAFNTFDIDTSAAGVATSRFLATSFNGATMLVCADAAPHAIAGCPSGSLLHYDLSVAGGVFTGIDALHGDTAVFRVAQSDDSMILLRAQDAPGGRLFQIGLSTNAGITADEFAGGDTLGRWAALSLTPPTLTERFLQPDGSTVNSIGALADIDGAPAGLAASFLGTSTSPTYVAADGRLAIVSGQAGGPLDGLLQLFVN